MSPKASLALITALLTAAFGCGPQVRDRTPANASDEWTRLVPFEKDGEIVIVNRYGSVEVTGVIGNTVSVRVERIAHAPTEANARDLVPKIAIEEKVGLNRLSLRTEGIAGVLIGVTFETNYRVNIPATALVRVQTADGAIRIVGITGRVAAQTNSGSITGRDLGGAVDVRTAGGDVSLDLASITSEPIAVRAGRGGAVQLSVPATANANLSASAANANISVTGLTFDPIGEQETGRRPRRVRGRVNKGGTPIELSSVGGDISVRAREGP